VAERLGLKLEGEVIAGGAGPGRQTGHFVRNSRWSLVGLEGFSQPVSMALPLPELSAAMGRPLDGIIGGEFIKQFVVEVDYQALTIRLHDPATFIYRGAGETIPIDFVNVTHPVVTATVTPVGGEPVERKFIVDIGAGQALTLHSPFVEERQLLGPGSTTFRALGGAGAGGRTVGRFGRVESLRIGSFTLTRPITMFSQDKAGAFANPALAGNLGAQIMTRFRTYFDYSRKRLILEPSLTYRDSFDRAFSGVALRAAGSDYRTFRVLDVLEDSAASEAGLKEGDVIVAIDDRPAERLTISIIQELFEKPVSYAVTLRRGEQTLKVTLTPRPTI
jgi:membrane-associated protease RseP (regulator of RpoE activity)